MKLILKSKQAGFTLIELMIVVGIIGILVSIAGPNFARYQSKARQAEAKISLAAIYGGQKSFYSEYSAYIGDVAAVGYIPEGNKRFYSVGWENDWAGTVSGFTNATATRQYARTNFPATWTSCTPALSTVPAANASDAQAFTTTASGQIRDTTICDVWTIDQNKVLLNSTIGL